MHALSLHVTCTTIDLQGLPRVYYELQGFMSSGANLGVVKKIFIRQLFIQLRPRPNIFIQSK